MEAMLCQTRRRDVAGSVRWMTGLGRAMAGLDCFLVMVEVVERMADPSSHGVVEQGYRREGAT